MSVSSAISALLSRLRESSIQETIAFLGINQQIEELQSNLQKLQSYTVDADQGINKDERIRGWLAKISDIYYEAEDVLDDYALKVASMRRTGGLKDVVKRYFCSFREMEAGNKVEIATLNKRIKELVDLLRQNDRVVSTDAEGENSNEARRPLELTGAASLIERGNIVGFAEDMASINENMKTKEEYRVVIAICGMAGSGKTTLAKLIYESSAMVEHFDVRAWCTVGQTYQLRLVLLQILGESRECDDRFVQRNDTELLQLLHQRLIGRRYLVVLDDVWSLDIWVSLRRALPDDRNNSKVLVTTRHRALPHQMVGNYVHEMRPLSTEESRLLFMRTAFPNSGPDEYVDGVIYWTLLILVTMQDMKDIKAKERMGTDMVLENLVALQKSCLGGYYNLPHDLRPLFLYLGHFPEDSEIEAEKLYLLWMAEGIIPLEHGGKTVMEMTSSILDDLVDRSIVLGQDEEGPTIRKFKSYSLHYLMRNMCLFKAKAESFFEVLDLRHSNLLNNDCFLPSSTRKIHRLAMYLDQYEDVFDDDLKPTIAQVFLNSDSYNSLVCTSLRRLKIEEAAMGKLTYFTIERCKSLWRLTIEEAAMPKLTYLTFERCKSLEAPLSLVDLICLKEVKISSMPKEFEDGLREVQKERDEYGDDLSIKIFDNNHEVTSSAIR
ncbi:uncharacterized protein LOC128071139 [Budorcas taxicolor]|uniref:uncharacterized protein LOC128071139 n=1 Tax=Budorcas taxicolor TaxID=37181 RepID=UPI002283742D|nr:uncharacterized protein LOC128071139 [Budorcas taxicolor]